MTTNCPGGTVPCATKKGIVEPSVIIAKTVPCFTTDQEKAVKVVFPGLVSVGLHVYRISGGMVETSYRFRNVS